MDSKSDKKTRSASQSFARKRGGEDTRSKAEESRALKESQNEKASTACRNAQEAKKVKSRYAPIKEQLEVLVEYIKILENRKQQDFRTEMTFLIGFLDALKRQCEIYQNYEMIKTSKA